MKKQNSEHNLNEVVGNPIPKAVQSEKRRDTTQDVRRIQRPSTTFSFQTGKQPYNILVTPKINETSTLTVEAQKNVLQRQLTMQLMPMYRVRQRSAGVKPMSKGSMNGS